MDDFSVWEELKKTVVPLANKRIENLFFKPLPPRLHVFRRPSLPLPYVLNLHGFSVAESYELVKRFIEKHQRIGTKKITIITGKGLKKMGLIKQEITIWFETPVFKDKIASFSWKNDGGALDVILKRLKK